MFVPRHYIDFKKLDHREFKDVGYAVISYLSMTIWFLSPVAARIRVYF